MKPRRTPSRLRRHLREQACARCGYCHSSEVLMGMPMEVEPLIPFAAGGRTEEDNLWLSCRRCNEFKGTQTIAVDPETTELVTLFYPRVQKWEDHFRWNEGGVEIIGLTPTGRATVMALKLNNPVIVVTRRLWVGARWWPPTE